MSHKALSTVVQPQGIGEDPLTHYSRLFTRFLQLVFYSWDKASYKWSQDDELTDIIIKGESHISREVVEKRPAIIVTRGPVSLSNISMDQFSGPIKDRTPDGARYIPNLDHDTGARRHTDLVSSTMTYNVLSSEGLEAQKIAWICSYATRTLKKSLLKSGIHRVGDDIQIGTETPPGALVQTDAKEIINVPVYVPFFFQLSYSIEPKDKILLKEVDMALNAEVGFPADGSIPIKEPGINGKTIWYSEVKVLEQAVTAGPWKSPRPRRL